MTVHLIFRFLRARTCVTPLTPQRRSFTYRAATCTTQSGMLCGLHRGMPTALGPRRRFFLRRFTQYHRVLRFTTSLMFVFTATLRLLFTWVILPVTLARWFLGTTLLSTVQAGVTHLTLARRSGCLTHPPMAPVLCSVGPQRLVGPL